MCLAKLLIKQKKAMTACSFNLYCLLVIYFTVYGKITLVRTRTVLFVWRFEPGNVPNVLKLLAEVF